MYFIFEKVDNTVRKGEKPGYQHLLISIPQCFLFFSHHLNPLPDDKILDKSKLKQSADDNFKFHENSRKFFKHVGNTVGKGEIAHYKQFLLYLKCFPKAYFPGASEGVTVWEWVKSFTS